MLARLVGGRHCGRALLLTSTLLGTGIVKPALAQTPPPARFRLDANGIDLATGRHVLVTPSIPIGPAESQLRLMRGYGHYVQLSGGIWSATTASGDAYRSYTFTLSGGVFTPLTGEGATLVNTNPGYVLTLADGTEYTYADTMASNNQSYAKARLTKLKFPDGETLTMAYVSVTYCTNNLDNCQNGTYITKVRLQSVTSSYGYQVRYNYQNNNANTAAGGANWDKLVSAIAVNLAFDYCDPSAASCTTSQPGPQASYSSGFNGQLSYTTITNPVGGATTYTTDNTPGAQKFKIKRPSSTTDNIIVSYNSSGLASSVAVDGRTWNYSFTLAGAQRTATITNPDNTTRVVVSDINVGLPVSVKDELNRTTTYAYDSNGRLTRATAPEGDYVQYTYDTRGNVTEQHSVAKVPGTPADIVTTALYPASCSNAKTCNQPSWTKDAKGNQTDYSYDPTHGGVSTVTLPAVTVNGASVRPQTRYGYSALQAYYKNASGSIVASGVTAYRLTSTSSCQTSASCVNTGDEVRTVTSYGPQTPGVGNNLLPVSASGGSGAAFQAGNTAALSAIAVRYDRFGNAVEVDGPVAGAADTTTYRYDAARRLTGIIAADPDSGGPLPRTATRITFNADSQPTLVERGTVNGVTDSDWSAFSSLQQQQTVYDNILPVRQTVTAGGTIYGVTQVSYDALGRVDCVALRMNDTAWGSLPASACTAQATGSGGSDRITKTIYTAASEVQKTTSAYGTPDAADEATFTYSANGRAATVTDANGNVTTYGYDGHDRPSTTTYAGGSYEQLTYDANSAVIQRRARDGQVIGFAYDALNRLVTQDRPNSAYWETDQSYAYDLLGRMTQASDSNGRILGFGYDALSRRVSQSDNWYSFGNAGFQYDAAGQRTRLTWADGNYVSYEYNPAGAMTVIRENGGLALASFGYDSLGRRTSLTRGNGTSSSYGYDPVSRLASLGHAISGSTYWNVNWSFGYNAAGQISSSTRSHDGYAWTGHFNVDRPYGVNSLNQLTSTGGTSLGYDGRGNLTSSGSTTFSYTADNQLAIANGVGLAHDPLGRLFNGQLDGNGVNLSVTYDGAGVLAELDHANPGGVLRRYVYGPGADEPLVWYEGSGLSDRRWLHADERGSVVAITNGAGAALAINRYDEYGIPQSGNVGRFQYTGQKWLPSIGLYDYKARMYSPTLGRFMQTDPIGYGDGVNWYNYVGGDPVNGTDPSGLAGAPPSCTGSRLCTDQNGGGSAAGVFGYYRRSYSVEDIKLRGAVIDGNESPTASGHWQRTVTNYGGVDIASAWQLVDGPIDTQLNYGQGSLDDNERSDIVVTAKARVLAARAEASIKVSANDLHHIFNDPDHLLDPVVKAYGSARLAGNALSTRAQLHVSRKNLLGRVEFQVRIAGYGVTVSGQVVNGVFRFGTAFIPSR